MVKAFRMLALRHLTERPVRTATTMLGVALGCAVFVAIRTANVEVLRSFEMAVDSVAGRATLMVTAGDLGFDERVIIPIRAHPDVQSATPVISLGASIAEGPLQGKSLQILGLDLPFSFLLYDLAFLRHRIPLRQPVHTVADSPPVCKQGYGILFMIGSSNLYGKPYDG